MGKSIKTRGRNTLMSTIISWTDVSWNPIWGCSHRSEGCRECYAETLAQRYYAEHRPWTKSNAKHNLQYFPDKLSKPYKWKKPIMCFVNSMSDMFHEDLADEWIAACFAVMNDPKIIEAGHIFQILTKREDQLHRAKPEWWTKNIWMGVSVEDRKNLRRIDFLRDCPAQTKFISFEPLLEDLGEVNLAGIDWAIVGGESGVNHRPMDHAWARSIRNQCLEQDVEFFFKQSAAFRTEQGTALVEEDGARNVWKYFPIDGHRFRDNGKPTPFVFEGYDRIEDKEQSEIMAKTEQIKVLVGDMRNNTIEIGKQLSEVQEILAKKGSGTFLSWLSEEFGWAKSTAYRFMDVYKRFGVLPNLGRMKIDQSALYKLAAESTPDKARDKAVEMANAGEKITMKVAEELIEDAKPKPAKKQASKSAAKPPPEPEAEPQQQSAPKTSSKKAPPPTPTPGPKTEVVIEFSEFDSHKVIIAMLTSLYGPNILEELKEVAG